jgi:uncharacterized protein
MRIIITGGTGLIGQALTANLAMEKHEIIILSRYPDTPGLLIPSSAKLVGWDGRTAEGWGHLADGADAIVNLAGASIADGRWTPARKQAIRDSRVNAGQAVVEAVRAASQKPRTVIQASAVGYYGPHLDDAELTEDARRGSDFLARLAEEWENSTKPVEALDVRRAVLRFGVVLSAQGGALPRMAGPFRYFIGGPLASGRQWVPWIHIDDVVAVIRFLIERGDVRGVYNVCAPNPVRNDEFSHMIGKAMRRPCWLGVPEFALQLLFGDMAVVLTHGQHQIPQRLQRMRYPWRFDEAPAAVGDLLR